MTAASPPRLLDRVRTAVRVRHMSVRTERAYVGWIRRYVRFHGLRHPTGLGEADLAAWLSSLSATRGCSASTLNQARSAVVFLYREVLGRPPGWGASLPRVRRPGRLPVVLTRAEVAAVLGRMTGTPLLVASLLYGSGLRVLEAMTLRVKDLDLGRLAIRVRDGKGRTDRVTMLPRGVAAGLAAHLVQVRAQHAADLTSRCSRRAASAVRPRRGAG